MSIDEQAFTITMSQGKPICIEYVSCLRDILINLLPLSMGVQCCFKKVPQAKAHDFFLYSLFALVFQEKRYLLIFYLSYQNCIIDREHLNVCFQFFEMLVPVVFKYFAINMSEYQKLKHKR